MYLIVESGAISAVANIIVIGLFASNSPASLTGLDVVCQLLVWVQSSFRLLHALTSFLAGIDATLDHRAGWTNWSISYSTQ